MKTVTSVSGGRTSSYMALNYPTDYNIFSLVRIEDPLCAPSDKSIIRYVEDKIEKPFIATAESDKTLYVLRQLEQDLGKEIIWVTGKTFEQLIRDSNANGNYLPNRRKRFCTQLMKLDPIFWYCYLNLMESEDDFISMNIGYRSDEKTRKATDEYDFIKSTKNFGLRYQNHEIIEWRESHFPLRKDNIDQFTIRHYFTHLSSYDFPVYSNCAGCFNKTEKELQEQFVYEPNKMAWFKRMEEITGSRWNISATLSQIEQMEFTEEQVSEMSRYETCNCTD